MSGARGLLVDLDGTLADTAAANYGSYSAALAEAGVDVDRAGFDAVAQGRNWRQFLPELLAASGSGAEPVAIARRKAEIYHSRMGEVVVNQMLAALIASVRESPSWRTALVTTASAANAGLILGHYDLARLFDTIVTGDDVRRHKPDPEAYNLAAARLGLRPEDCVILEDSAIGVAAGLAFGGAVLQFIPPVAG